MTAGKWRMGWPGGGVTGYPWYQDANLNKFAFECRPEMVRMENGKVVMAGRKCIVPDDNCTQINIGPANAPIYVPVATLAGALTSTYDEDYECDLAPGVPGFNYGIFEIRAKLPGRRDDYSYFWLWGPYWQCGNLDNDLSCGGAFPAEPCQAAFCSGIEIDVFEAVRKEYNQQERFQYFSTIQPNNAQQFPLNNINQCTQCPTFYEWKNSEPDKTFHTYTVAWTPDSVTWFIDGTEIRTQREYIPDFKMELNIGLHLNDMDSPDGTDDMAVDYVRLYRPAGYNYGSRALNGTVFGRLGSAAYESYVSLYNEDNSYLSKENYNFTEANNAPFPNVATSSAIREEFDAVQNTMEPIVYLTAGDGMLYRSVMNYHLRQLEFVGPLQKGNNAIITNISSSPSSLAVMPAAKHQFYAGTDGRMYIRINNAMADENDWPVLQLQSPATEFVAGDVVAVEGNDVDPVRLHPSRVYYRNGNNTLCYFEWNAQGGTWDWHQTNVNNLAGQLVAAREPWGKLYYRGTDKRVWNVWGYQNQPFSFSYLSANYNDFNQGATPTCSGAIAVSPDGKRVYYPSFYNFWKAKIVYLQDDGLAWSHHETEVDDYIGNRLIVKNLPGPDVRDEVLYIGNANQTFGFPLVELDENKVKTLYVRPTGGDWVQAPAFPAPREEKVVTTLDHLTQTHRPTYYVESHFNVANWLEASDVEPRIVFAQTKEKVFGFYRRDAMELCPAPYENCTWNPEIDNDIEFRQGTANESSQLKLYPNPTDGQLWVELPANTVAETVYIIGINGQKNVSQCRQDGNQMVIDMSAFPNGIYAIRILGTDGQVFDGKIALFSNH